MNAHTSPLAYRGQIIADKGDMLSLTDMWKAAGSPANQDPAQWQRSAAADAFIEAVSINMGISHNNLIESRKRGGTWANWQVAFAYAKYLSPEFHMWCNQVVRERMEGKPVNGIPSDLVELIRRTNGIARQMNGKFTDMALTYAMRQEAMQAEIHSLHAEIDRINTGLRRDGVTSLQVWHQYNLAPGIRGTSQWMTRRLIALGAAIPFNGKANIGGRPIHLFDPDKVDYFMKETGLLLQARTYAAERMGQGKLKV